MICQSLGDFIENASEECFSSLQNEELLSHKIDWQEQKVEIETNKFI
jgi:hypothetical protein